MRCPTLDFFVSSALALLKGCLIFAALILLWWISGVRINTSASLPYGFYVRSDAGTLVEFCPDDAGISAKRGYRAGGICADGHQPLLKPIAALVGDTVEFSAQGISVNGALLANTRPREKDSAGRAMQHYPFGPYEVKPGEIWVASSYEARSYDSRYFGPVAAGRIRGRMRDLWTW